MADGIVIIDTLLDSTGFENGVGKLKGLASKGAGLATKGIAAIGTALTGLGAYAVKVGSDFEEGMSKVQAISGATSEEMQALSAKAKEMGASTKFSATESAEALQYMAMAGWKSEQMINGLPGIMNLAAASGEDLALTSDIVTDALTAFGMKAEESSHFADILAAASSNSNTNVAMLGESFKYVAPVCGALGYSAEDTSIALGLMANSGIKASQAGTTLKTALTNMAKPTKKMKAAMDEYHISLQNSDGSMKSLKEVMDMLRTNIGGLDLEMTKADGTLKSYDEIMQEIESSTNDTAVAQKVATAATIFGKESMSGMLAIINASESDYQKLTDAIYNCDGAAVRMAATMQDNLKGQVTLLKSALEGLGIEIYESVDNPMKDVVKTANLMVADLMDAFKTNGFEGLTQQLGTVFSEIVKGIADYTPKIINASVNVIKAFMKGIKDNKRSISASAVDILESLSSGILDILPDIVDVGADLIVSLIDGLSDKTPELIPVMTDAVIKIAESILDNGELFIEAGGKLISNVAKGLSDSIPGLGIILDPLSDVLQLIGNNADFAVTGILAIGSALLTLKAINTVQSLTSNFIALGSSIGSITSLGPFIVAVAAVGAGVALLTEEERALNNTFNVSEEKMGIVKKTLLSLNGVQTKSRKELEEMGAVYEEFGENIGNNFKDSVENATTSIHGFSVKIKEISLDEVLSDSETSDFNSRVEECVNSAINTVDSKKSEMQETMKNLFASDGEIDENEQVIIDLCTREFEVEAEEVRKNQDAINQIYNQARTEGRALTDDEIDAIKQYYAQIKQIELEAQAENNDELEYSKIDFNNRVKNLDAAGASELLIQKKSQLDELIIQKENEYDQIISKAQEGAENLSGTEREAAEEKIELLKQKKEEAIQNYTDEWDEYQNIVEKEAPSIVGEYNKYSGELLSAQDKVTQQGLEKMQQHYEGLGQVSEEGWYRIRNTTTDSMDDVYMTVNETTGEITGCWDSTSGEVAGYTEDMKNSVKKLGEEHEVEKLSITTSLGEIAGSSVNASGQMVNAMGSVISELYNFQETSDGTYTAIANINGKPIKIETNADGVILGMQQVGNSMDDVTTKADGTSEEVKNKFIAAANKMPEVGANIVAGIGNGIDSNKGGLFSKIGAMCSGLLQAAKEALDIHSPSRVMRDQVGKNIVAGIQVGMEEQSPSLVDTARIICNQISGAFENTLSKDVAEQVINRFKSVTGVLGNLTNELNTAQERVNWANGLTLDDNKWYYDAKTRLEDVKYQLEELSDQISDTEDKNTKKSLQEQQKALQKKQKLIQKEYDYYKEAAQNEINERKEATKKELEIAKEKYSKLEDLSKALTTAIKNQINEQKNAAISAIEAQEDAAEKAYNKQVEKIESTTKKKVDSIQSKIDALEEEEEAENRLQEVQEANNNIEVLQAKMNNTASEADKKAYAIKIKNAKAALAEKEKEWDREDEKKKLQEKIDNINSKAEAQKEALKEEYEATKEKFDEQIKVAEEYYEKLLETDSINAQARYMLLTRGNDELVQLLQSYNPLWQDAGQSLADSLINGLNSKKGDMASAVAEMTSMRNGITIDGYATGTASNRIAGAYTVDEKGFELSTNNNPVAYVSKGAGIINHMQSLKAVKNEVSSQVATQMSALKNMVLGQQRQMYQLAGAIAGTTNTSSTDNSIGTLFHADKVEVRNQDDIKSLASELGFHAQRNKRC
ncbi:phage tail tape measure protein [Clostridium butyricum]|nr:phage tail tape measure protein [Clostridium butyricum]EDT75156.1 phage tail tape measure protein, family, core region domain protein [Clostridium butyricum 5521]